MTFLYKSLYLQIRLQKPQKEPMAKECKWLGQIKFLAVSKMLLV